MKYKENNKFCVYLTIYSGNALPEKIKNNYSPMFYIGSSSIDKVAAGYTGSVSSKKYKDIWKYENKHNPQLFKTLIIETFINRKEAFEYELQLQLYFNVVKNPLFVNLALAQKNGCHGNISDNPWNKGVPRTTEDKLKISIGNKGKKRTKEQRKTYSDARKNYKGPKRVTSDETKKKISNANKGKPNHSDKWKEVMYGETHPASKSLEEILFIKLLQFLNFSRTNVFNHFNGKISKTVITKTFNNKHHFLRNIENPDNIALITLVLAANL
jgi:hypothetical protein